MQLLMTWWKKHNLSKILMNLLITKSFASTGSIYILITWSKSKIELKDEFHQKLLAILPAGVRLFGGRELHQDDTPHYHVVFSFLHKVNWPDAAKKFSIEGDTNAIRFE